MIRILFVMSLLVVVGCYSEEAGVSVGYGYSAAPNMVYVGDGVQVISDYDYPVFYSDNYYWRNNGGVWYRSGTYNGGWVASYDVPVGVRGIARPESYAHYRGGATWNGNGNGGAAYRGGGPAYRGGGGADVRDHRSAPAPAYRSAPPPARPVVRDHRR